MTRVERFNVPPTLNAEREVKLLHSKRVAGTYEIEEGDIETPLMLIS